MFISFFFFFDYLFWFGAPAIITIKKKILFRTKQQQKNIMEFTCKDPCLTNNKLFYSTEANTCNRLITLSTLAITKCWNCQDGLDREKRELVYVQTHKRKRICVPWKILHPWMYETICVKNLVTPILDQNDMVE